MLPSLVDVTHENTVKLTGFGTWATNASTFLKRDPYWGTLNYILCCSTFSAGLAPNSCFCAVPHHRAPASFCYTKKSQSFQNFNYPRARHAPQSPFFLTDYCYMTQGMTAGLRAPFLFSCQLAHRQAQTIPTLLSKITLKLKGLPK